MRSQKAVRGGKRSRTRPPRRKRAKRPRCRGGDKVRYESQDEAIAALALIAGRPKTAGAKVPIRTYLCERCGGYHLTSMPKLGP